MEEPYRVNPMDGANPKWSTFLCGTMRKTPEASGIVERRSAPKFQLQHSSKFRSDNREILCGIGVAGVGSGDFVGWSTKSFRRVTGLGRSRPNHGVQWRNDCGAGRLCVSGFALTSQARWMGRAGSIRTGFGPTSLSRRVLPIEWFGEARRIALFCPLDRASKTMYTRANSE
jgi:hypothetical protein